MHTLLVKLYLDAGQVLTGNVKNIATHTSQSFPLPAVDKGVCDTCSSERTFAKAD